MTTAHNIQKCRAGKKNVGPRQPAMKFIFVTVLAAGFLLSHTFGSFAEEQPAGQKDSGPAQLLPVNALTKPDEKTQEPDNIQTPAKDPEDTSWQSIKIDKSTSDAPAANSSCPCDSTGVRSRLIRMGGISENSGPGYGGRGMGGGSMGRGRR